MPALSGNIGEEAAIVEVAKTTARDNDIESTVVDDINPTDLESYSAKPPMIWCTKLYTRKSPPKCNL
jgi:hypothetical protein